MEDMVVELISAYYVERYSQVMIFMNMNVSLMDQVIIQEVISKKPFIKYLIKKIEKKNTK